MKKIVFALIAVGATVGVVAFSGRASGQTAAVQSDGESAPIFLNEIPPGYRDWSLISVGRLTAGNLAQLRSQVGNDIAIKAYKEGKLPFPDGTVIAALHWNEAPSEENTKVLAMIRVAGVPPQSSVAGPLANVQFMVKDSKKYAATGGWGFGDFTDGKPANEAAMKTCFACHQLAKDHDLVFARYAASH